MSGRKLLTFLLSKISKTKKNNRLDNLSHEASQLLSDDIKSVIISFLPDQEQIKMAKINKDLYRYIKSKSTYRPCFYYAVGSNIDLYPQIRFISLEHEIVHSLDKNILLFQDYHIAKKYAYLRQNNYYDRGLDFFMPLSAPSVFVVQLLKDGPYNKIAAAIRIEENIPDCPAPPAAMTMVDSGFKTSSHNVKIHFSNFNGRLFKYDTAHGRFSAAWSRAVSGHNNLQQSAMAGMLAIFNSYFTCYARFTRHNQALVRQVLDKVSQNPSIEDLHHIVTSAYQDGMRDMTINKKGEYMQMLNFVNIQLNLLRKIGQLPGIDEYIKQNAR